MATDDLDQSFSLATLLTARYEAVWSQPAEGGGRLDYRTLPGTHVTPNLPALRGLSWDAAELVGSAAGGVAGRLVAGQAREVSDRLAFEQEALCAVIAAYALAEAERCAGGWAG